MLQCVCTHGPSNKLPRHDLSKQQCYLGLMVRKRKGAGDSKEGWDPNSAEQCRVDTDVGRVGVGGAYQQGEGFSSCLA